MDNWTTALDVDSIHKVVYDVITCNAWCAIVYINSIHDVVGNCVIDNVGCSTVYYNPVIVTFYDVVNDVTQSVRVVYENTGGSTSCCASNCETRYGRIIGIYRKSVAARISRIYGYASGSC